MCIRDRGTTPLDCRIKRNFCVLWSFLTKEIASYKELSLEMKPEFTTTNRTPNKFCTQPSTGKVMLTLLGWTRCNFGAQYTQLWKRHECNVCRSSPAIMSSDVDFEYWYFVAIWNAWLHSTCQHLQPSKIWNLSVYHILQTFHLVIFMCLIHSKIW